MATKRSVIEALFKEGKKIGEITETTGFSYGYVGNIISDIRCPGTLARTRKNYEKSGRRREAKQNWKKLHPILRSKYRKNMFNAHQDATRPLAVNSRQEWTIRDIEYLEQYGSTKTVRQMALDLRRSFASVQTKAFKMGIDLRGDKMGANAARFVGIYKK